MKKIFSLFAAVLFAGSMMAGVTTFKIDSIAEANSWTNGTAYTTVTISPVTLTAKGGGNNGKYYSSDDTWRFYNGGSLEIVVKDSKVTKVESTPAATFNIDEKGKAVYTDGGLKTKFTEIKVTYTDPDPSSPVLDAEDIDFGLVAIAEEAEAFELDTTLDVTAKNLTEDIAVTDGAHVNVVEEQLAKEGGKLHLKIVAAEGDFSDKIVLTSGETSINVAITGTVKKTAVLPGTSAKMTFDNNKKSYDATVNGVKAVKVGTGSADGSMTITVPAGAIKLHFYAVAWTDAAGTIELAAEEVTFAPKDEVSILADKGIQGGDNNYELEDLNPAECRFDIELTGVTAEKSIVVSSGTARRFVIWGATYETSGGETAVDNTNADVKAVKFFENGQLVIIKNGVKYNATGAIIK